MDLSEFYDSLVLRDLLQYTAPGLVVISALIFFLDAFDVQVIVAIIAVTKENPWIGMFFILFSAYVTGHILTAVHTRFLRSDERKLAYHILNEDEWLKSRIAQVMSVQMRMPEADCTGLLENEKTAEVIREVAEV